MRSLPEQILHRTLLHVVGGEGPGRRTVCCHPKHGAAIARERRRGRECGASRGRRGRHASRMLRGTRKEPEPCAACGRPTGQRKTGAVSRHPPAPTRRCGGMGSRFSSNSSLEIAAFQNGGL